tara:strand:- start:34 stop:240 length:207 start_codon:yes stop_codon:yes gene_type:complete
LEVATCLVVRSWATSIAAVEADRKEFIPFVDKLSFSHLEVLDTSAVKEASLAVFRGPFLYFSKIFLII